MFLSGNTRASVFLYQLKKTSISQHKIWICCWILMSVLNRNSFSKETYVVFYAEANNWFINLSSFTSRFLLHESSQRKYSLHLWLAAQIKPQLTQFFIFLKSFLEDSKVSGILLKVNNLQLNVSKYIFNIKSRAGENDFRQEDLRKLAWEPSVVSQVCTRSCGEILVCSEMCNQWRCGKCSRDFVRFHTSEDPTA